MMMTLLGPLYHCIGFSLRNNAYKDFEFLQFVISSRENPLLNVLQSFTLQTSASQTDEELSSLEVGLGFPSPSSYIILTIHCPFGIGTVFVISFLLKDSFMLCGWALCLRVHLCTSHYAWGQKRVSVSPELELQMAGSHHVGAGAKSKSSARAGNAVSQPDISPAPL